MLGILLLLYVSWLVMMAMHELGHVLHAWLSGGEVALVYIRPFDFSRTDLSVNPHPQFVAWGGSIWGCAIPLAAFGLMHWRRLRWAQMVRFFAGFCLVANGGYIGLGWISRIGDAGTLLRHGAAPWVLAVSGLAAMAGGLWLWHGLGPRPWRAAVGL